MIELILSGTPVPAARPRVTRFRTYNPKQKEMQRIKNEISSIFGREPLTCPLAVYFRFFMQIPRSLSKTKREYLASGPCTKRPDIDNLLKMYLDAMNELVYKDDSQIYSVDSIKVYSFEPRVEIGIVEYPKEGFFYGKTK